MTLISVIIPTFNSVKFIGPCLDSVITQIPIGTQVIVVDNGSIDGTKELIAGSYPSVKVIANEKNLGASRARNQAIDESHGEWVLTLDSDVILEENFFRRLKTALESVESDTGIIQAKILNGDKITVYSAGIFLSGLKRFFDQGRNTEHKEKWDKRAYIFGACCAAAVYRRKMLQQLKEDTGYFDERFFFLVEDVDLSLRAQKKGWKAVYDPKLVCFHKGNSSGFDAEKRQYLCWRNRKLMLEKTRLNPAYKCVLCLLYDFPRLLYLSLTNQYVRRRAFSRDEYGAAC
jgi:hypothetical protein